LERGGGEKAGEILGAKGRVRGRRKRQGKYREQKEGSGGGARGGNCEGRTEREWGRRMVARNGEGGWGVTH